MGLRLVVAASRSSAQGLGTALISPAPLLIHNYHQDHHFHNSKLKQDQNWQIIEFDDEQLKFLCRHFVQMLHIWKDCGVP